MTLPTHQKYLTAALVVGCVVLLQWHSVMFWMGRAELGPAGAGWSLLLEGCALWLWWQRRAVTMGLGMVASCLLLAGPMVQVAYPLAASISTAETVKFQDSSRVKLLKRQVSGLEKSLATYETNSTERLGWASRIDDTRTALQQARAALLDQVSAPVSSELPVLKKAVIAGQAVALLLFQIVAVLGVLRLSRWSEPVQAFSQPAESVSPLNHEEVASALVAYAAGNGLKGQALADALDESTTTLWRVQKHKPVSADTLRRVMRKLEAA